MYRYLPILVLSATLLLPNIVCGDPIFSTWNPGAARTTVDQLYGAPFESANPSVAPPGVAAFGQVFRVQQDAEVSSFSFYLNNSEGGTTQRRYNRTPRYIGYIMEWDPLDNSAGSAKLTQLQGQGEAPLFASQTVGIINGYTYQEFTVNVAGGTVLKADTDYVAFFSAFDAAAGAGLARIAAANTGDDAPGTGVVSNESIATRFADLHSKAGAFNMLNMDVAITIEGPSTGEPPPVLPPVLPPPGQPPVHAPEPASSLVWALLGCVAFVCGWRRWRR